MRKYATFLVPVLCLQFLSAGSRGFQERKPELEPLRLVKSIKLSPEYPIVHDPGEILHAFTPDNQGIYFHTYFLGNPRKGLEDDSAYVIDLRTHVIKKLDQIEKHMTMAVSPGAKWLTTFKTERGEKCKVQATLINIYKLPECQLMRSERVADLVFTAVAFDRSEQFLAVAFAEDRWSWPAAPEPIDRGRLMLFSLGNDQTWNLVMSKDLSRWPNEISFLQIIPALKWLVCAAGHPARHPLEIYNFDGKQIFEYEPPRKLRGSMTGPLKLISGMVVSPDQSRLVISYQDGFLRVWNLWHGLNGLEDLKANPPRILHFPRAGYCAPFFGPNSRWLFVLGAEFIPPDQEENIAVVIHVYDMKTYRLHARYQLPAPLFTGPPIVSHDGKLLALVTDEGDLQVYQLPREYWLGE